MGGKREREGMKEGHKVQRREVEERGKLRGGRQDKGEGDYCTVGNTSCYLVFQVMLLYCTLNYIDLIVDVTK